MKNKGLWLMATIVLILYLLFQYLYSERSDLSESAVRTDFLETATLIIEKRDSLQFQTDKQSGEKDEYRVYWIKECEYTLVSINNSMHRIRVKITDITPDGYTCYFLYGDGQSEKPMKMFIKNSTSKINKP